MPQFNFDAQESAALTRIRTAAEARQRFYDMMYARQEAEMAEEDRLAAEEERKGKLNWFDDMSEGAKQGSAFGPVGTLVGGIVGTFKGQKESYDQRRIDQGNKNNQRDRFEAFHNTALDTPFGFNLNSTLPTSKGFFDRRKSAGENSYGSLSGNTMSNLITAGGTAKGQYDKDKARRSQAQPQESEPLITPRRGSSSTQPSPYTPAPQENRTGFDTDPDAEMYRRYYERPPWY